MSKFKKYLEQAQESKWPAVAHPEPQKPGLGKRIKNFVLNKIGSIMGKKILFVETDYSGNVTPLGEINYDVESIQLLRDMIHTRESIIFEHVWKALQGGQSQRPHMVVDVLENSDIAHREGDDLYGIADGKNVVVEVKRNPRSTMFIPKDLNLPKG